MQPTETWATIPSHPNYQASNLGRIRRESTGRVRKPQNHGHGPKNQKKSGNYQHVLLDGRTRYVHHLVLEAFVGPKPTPKSDTLHANDQAQDNRLENLSWGTRTANMADCRANGNLVVGEAIPWAKLTASDVVRIRAEYAAGGVSLRTLARRYGVVVKTIHKVVRGRSWRSVPTSGL